MHTMFRLSGWTISILFMLCSLYGLFGLCTENVQAQYIPVLGVHQLTWTPDIMPQNQQALPQLPQNVVVSPVADNIRTIPPQSGLQTGQPQNPANPPQEMPGMIAQTILYFPPPSFPDPIPLTVYVPNPAAQQQMYVSVPYKSNMYAPPILVQPQYFGPQPFHSCISGYCMSSDYCPSGLCMKKPHTARFSTRSAARLAAKYPGPPGEPVIGPPTLVYPNGIVVQPKVYLPNQPFKNTMRAITP